MNQEYTSLARDARAVRADTRKDVRRAAEALRDIGARIGNFRVAPCANIAGKDPIIDHEGRILATSVFGWTGPDEQWWRQSRLALDSPIPQACRYESEPFWCNARGMHTHHPNPIVLGLDLSNFRRRSMTYASIVVPVHLPFGQVGAVSYTPVESDRTDLADDFARYGDPLGCYARVFISSYVKVSADPRAEPPSCRLGKREVECLRWASAGKTDAEIGVILGRSAATVRFHMQNAAAKLEAVNRSQTVFRATQLGYLGLSPEKRGEIRTAPLLAPPAHRRAAHGIAGCASPGR